MRRSTVFVLLLLATFALADGDPQYPDKHAAPHLSVKALRENPELFAGTWRGKWDDTWEVEFEIKGPDADGEFQVIYRWRENTNDKKLSHQNRVGRFNGGTIRTGAITIEYKGPHSLLAIGRFGKHTRVAVLNSPNYTGEAGEHEHDHEHEPEI